MLFGEYNIEDAIAVNREEAREEGIAEEREKWQAEIANNKAEIARLKAELGNRG